MLMSGHITIRGGLAATIAGYTLLLMLVIAAGAVGLCSSSTALRDMYRDDTASVLYLKTSSERLLLLRGALGEVEQVVSAGKPIENEIARLHALLAESDRELDAYRGPAYRTARRSCCVMPCRPREINCLRRYFGLR
jgi:methyl-accepting chemotaxis protein-1 (serine sensor receptor)